MISAHKDQNKSQVVRQVNLDTGNKLLKKSLSFL